MKIRPHRKHRARRARACPICKLYRGTKARRHQVAWETQREIDSELVSEGLRP